jgi:hypothetical protein
MATTSATQQKCPVCNGNKIIAIGNQAQVCPACGGSGTMPVPGLELTYALTFNLTALASATANISILNSDFRWVFAIARKTGDFLVQIQDAKANRSFFNVTPVSNQLQGVPDSMIFGTAELPGLVQPPYLFNQNGGIQVSVTDLSNANNTIWVGFKGQELVPSTSTDASSTSS